MYRIEKLPDADATVTEILGRPVVYLDHWALNDIALDDTLRKRFVSVMTAKAGTLRISITSMVEMIAQGDKSQVAAILDTVGAVDVGILNGDVCEVIRRENMLIENPSLGLDPTSDLELIEDFLRAHEYPSQVSVAELLRTPLLASGGRKKGQPEPYLDRLNSLAAAARSDPAKLKMATSGWQSIKAKGRQYSAATRELAQLALYFIVKNKGMKMDRGEWGDVFHVIVPVAYCDAVLLDGRWKSFVDQTGLRPPEVAAVFDKSGMAEFFEYLEDEDYLLGGG
ncbi:MAG: hypothetical protein HN976_31665 [Lentisphaerae bacterium]|nr:hypothetical protein [Lentisphaerota bacterium]MBT7059698.1 hypothetical protein [Lentisphaerota bacterium]